MSTRQPRCRVVAPHRHGEREATRARCVLAAAARWARPAAAKAARRRRRRRHDGGGDGGGGVGGRRRRRRRRHRRRPLAAAMVGGGAGGGGGGGDAGSAAAGSGVAAAWAAAATRRRWAAATAAAWAAATAAATAAAAAAATAAAAPAARLRADGGRPANRVQEGVEVLPRLVYLLLAARVGCEYRAVEHVVHRRRARDVPEIGGLIEGIGFGLRRARVPVERRVEGGLPERLLQVRHVARVPRRELKRWRGSVRCIVATLLVSQTSGWLNKG